jgi:hypothetical protein
VDLTYFEGDVDPVKGPLGFCNGFMGCRPMGFPMFRPYCKIL